MEKIKQTFNRIFSNHLCFAVVTNIITVFLGGILYHPFFEESDDPTIALIAEGAYGKQDYHLIYVNTILGRVLVGLQKLMPGVRWHTVLQYCFIFIALVLLTFILSHYKLGRCVSILIELACLYELYVSFQYTKTVTFITVAAVFAVLHHLHVKYIHSGDTSGFSKLSKVLILIFSYVTLLYAMLLRGPAFEIGILFALIPGFVDLVLAIKKNTFKVVLSYALYIVPVFTVFLVCTLVNNRDYSKDQAWDYFTYYNEARTDMVDFHCYALDWDNYGDKLEQIGLSANDTYMYATWQFADESIVTPELMKSIVAAPGTKMIDIDLIKAWIADIYKDLFAFIPIIIVFMGTVILMALCARFMSPAFWVVGGEILLFIVTGFYYEYSSRWVHRLVFSSMLAEVVLLLCFFIISDTEYFSRPIKANSGQIRFQTKSFLYILIGMSIFAALGQLRQNSNEHEMYNDDFSVLQMYMEEEKDKLFVADTFSTGDSYKYSVFSVSHSGALANYLTCGGWMTASPISRAITESYGYSDPFDALRYGDNVILVDNMHAERKADYLTEHNSDGNKYSAKLLENVSGYDLYAMEIE